MSEITPENQGVAVPVGIVGGGFAALIAYVVLRFRGVPAQNIRVFSADNSPGEAWLKMVQAIGQKTMRSESIGHFFPTDSPGLATLELFKKRSLKPIILSWFDQYRPTVESIIKHAHEIAQQVHFWQSLVPARIADIRNTADSFLLYNEKEELVARVNNVIIAVGHADPVLPEPVKKFKEMYPQDSRVNGAFDEKQVQPGHPYLVIGDGLSAATEWVRIIESGGCVIAVSQKGFQFGQPLTTPRRYMSKRGLGPFRRKQTGARCAELIQATCANIPLYTGWKKIFRQALAEGALHLIQGNVTDIQKDSTNKLDITVVRPGSEVPEIIEADQVIAATGFYPAIKNPLISQLIQDYNLPIHDRFLVLKDDCCIEKLSTPGSFAAVLGHASAWAIPCADSFAGMKIGARKIADYVAGKESWNARELARKTNRWAALVFGKELV